MGKISSSHEAPVFLVCIINMLITFCPFIDYYANWYVTIIPVVILFMLLTKDDTSFKKMWSILFIAIVLATINYWTNKRQYAYSSQLINCIIMWTPACISLLSVSILSDKFQKNYLQAAIIIMAITAFTTINGLKLYPNASREMALGGNEMSFYMLLNIGGFEHIYAFVISIPFAIWMVINTRGVWKFVNIICTVVLLYCIYESQYSIALLITLLAGVLILVNIKPKWKPYIYSFVFVFLLFAGTGLLSGLIRLISDNIESSYVADRLLQVALLLEGNSIDNIQTETTTERLELMRNAKEGFFSSPIWGHNWFSYDPRVLSGHSYVIDLLSASGILGSVLYWGLFYKNFKKIFGIRFREFNPYSRIIWILFICVTILNPSSFTPIYLVIFTIAFMINNITMNSISYESNSSITSLSTHTQG